MDITRFAMKLFIYCVISSMALEAGVGVDNQNWALTSTLAYYRLNNPIYGLKLELTIDY